MTEEELRQIAERADNATTGPWRATPKDCYHFMSSMFIDREDDERGVGLVTCDINQDNATLYASDEDMEFIAHAREDIPRLIAELRAERKRSDNWREQFAEMVFAGQEMTIEEKLADADLHYRNVYGGEA